MTDIPETLGYTPEHEWIAGLGGEGELTIGITAHAVSELGEIVFVELPEVGVVVEAGASCGEIESTKAVSEIYAPLAGEVVAVNDAIAESPEIIGDDPYGEGWLFKLMASDGERAELLDAQAYTSLIAD